MRCEVGRIALAVVALAAVLTAANYGYGLIHETAHAAVVTLLGGTVTDIYVNPAGLDACTEFTPLEGPGFIIVELAGLIATTAIAILLTLAGKEIVPAFFALRSLVYALNYSPGTDISNIHAVAGSSALGVTIALLAVNSATIVYTLGRHAALRDLFASLSRGRLLRSSSE